MSAVTNQIEANAISSQENGTSGGKTTVTISLPAVSIEPDQVTAASSGSGAPLRRLRGASMSASVERARDGEPTSSSELVAAAAARHDKRQMARRELSVDDTCSKLSMASTTSDVNSDDDAASIASRLSQIVSEQEFALMNLTGQPRAMHNDGSGGPLRKTQGQYKSTSSLAVNKNPTHTSSRLKQVRSSADVCQQAALSSLELEEHERLDGRPAIELAPSARFHVDDRPDSSENLERPPHRSSGNLFQPERGNLKALETSRQQQLDARLKRSDSFGKNKGANEQLQQQQQQLGAEPMLNICRSAWRLDEFEQAFKPTGDSCEPQEAAFAPGDQETNTERQRIFSLGSSGSEGQTNGGQTLASSDQLKRQSSVRNFLDRNLLIRASKNALSMGQTGNVMTTSNSSQQANTNASRRTSLARELTAATLSSSARRHSHQLEVPGAGPGPGVGRQSRAMSISSSIASSLDSFQSARPFGRLASMLDPREQRRRRRHKQDSTVNKLNGQSVDDDDGELRGGNCCCPSGWQTLKEYVPILEWLPNYKLQYFYGDFTAGMAVAVLNISLCLSAAVVAETDMGTAFRASTINTLIYAVLCSSRHTSFGSWSIMSQMLLECVRRALTDELILNRINLGPSAAWSKEEYEKWHMNIMIMYTFLIGLIQLLGGTLNLGNLLASFIPEALCSAMIAATAFTMSIGQLANMCGTSNKILWAVEKKTTELAWADLKNAPVSITDLFAGTFRWIQQIALLVKHHEQINKTCVVISISSVVLLALNQSFLQDWLRRLFKKKNLFVPFELLLLIVMIIISYWLNLQEAPYRVTTCGPIAINYALPNVPNLRLVRELWFDALATALISFTMVYIMSRTYSNKLNYEIDSNQELIACGMGNLVGGLFDTLPATGTFSRTTAQVEAGGQTQMASIINCIILIIVAQLFGHHVAQLPVCVMSAALFFSFVRMMARLQDALTYWRLCKVDFAIWLVTFMAIVTLNLVEGFVYSFIFSILTMLYRAQNRRCYLLGSIGSSDVYVPLSKYPLARELDGIKIFQFCGPIHYVSADLFERLLRQKTRVNVKQLIQAREQQLKQHQLELEASKTTTMNQNGHSLENNNNNNQAQLQRLPTHIILDFSMISFIDSAGVHVLKKIIVDYQQVNVTIMIASLASHVAAVVKSEPPLWEAHKDRFYVTLADAVHHATMLHHGNKQQQQQQRRKSNVSIQFYASPMINGKKDMLTNQESSSLHQNEPVAPMG